VSIRETWFCNPMEGATILAPAAPNQLLKPKRTVLLNQKLNKCRSNFALSHELYFPFSISALPKTLNSVPNSEYLCSPYSTLHSNAAGHRELKYKPHGNSENGTENNASRMTSGSGASTKLRLGWDREVQPFIEIKAFLARAFKIRKLRTPELKICSTRVHADCLLLLMLFVLIEGVSKTWRFAVIEICGVAPPANHGARPSPYSFLARC
jgi:hypothetical protein